MKLSKDQQEKLQEVGLQILMWVVNWVGSKVADKKVEKQ